jgi:hypothetical protein
MPITLVIDYGTGAKKTFTGIPYQAGMDVFAVMEAAAAIAPGVEFSVVETSQFVNRAGLASVGFAAIDGVEKREESGWRLLVNGEPREWTEQTAGLSMQGHRPRVPDNATVTVTLSG